MLGRRFAPKEEKEMKKVPIITNGGTVHISIDKETDKISISQIESEYRFASLFKNCSRLLVNNIKELDKQDYFKIRSYVVSAIILSYSFLEAALNEFISINVLKSDVADGVKDKFKLISDECLIQKDKKNILQVYNMYLRILGKPEILENQRVYQSANIVRIVRNMLVHPIPGKVITFSSDEKLNLSEQQDIVKKLRSYLELTKDETFPECIYSYKCAKWASDSCESFLQEFVDKSGINPGFLIKNA